MTTLYWGIVVRFPARISDISDLHIVQLVCGTHIASYPIYKELKRPRLEGDSLPPCSTCWGSENMEFYLHSLIWPSWRTLELCSCLHFCLHSSNFLVFNPVVLFFVSLLSHSSFLRTSPLFYASCPCVLTSTVHVPTLVALLSMTILSSVDHCSLGHDVVQLGKQMPTFRKNLLLSLGYIWIAGWTPQLRHSVDW